MTQAEKEKNYIDTLLNAISTNDAIEVFNLIDHKIIKLLECSTEDFMLLNAEFKNYFKDYKHINTTAKNLSETFSKLLNEETIGKVDANFDNIEDQIKSHIEGLQFNLSIINTLTQKHTNNFLLINNIKQNFSSLKLLIASLKLGDTSNPTTSSTIDTSINEIKLTISLLENQNEKLKIQLSEIVSSLKSFQLKDQQSAIELAHNSFLQIKEISVKAPSITELIKEFSSSCSTRIEKIITNLQYNDIIRQKIEHIQRSHKDILCELNNLIENEGKLSIIHNKVKVFFKIRDIAGLQAAQLLHANLQYQSAISEINSDLDLIGSEMISISKQSNLLFSNNSDNLPINDFQKSLNSILQLVNTDLKIDSSSISKLHLSIDEFNEQINNAVKAINDLAIIILNYVDNVKKKEISQTDKNNLDLISNLIKEINLAVVQVPISDEQKIIELKEFSSGIKKNLDETIQFVNNLIKDTQPLYIEEKNLIVGVSLELKSSIKRVKYYELFEEVCDDIIDKLNQLNLKLNYGREIESPITREENLAKLKSRYTMESEHLIHDHLANNIVDVTQSEATLLGLIEQKTDEDDDNLELF